MTAAFGVALRTMTDSSWLPARAVSEYLVAPSGNRQSGLDGCTYGLDAYCLGSDRIDLLYELSARRRIVMHAVFTAGRMRQVEENSWGLNGGGPVWSAADFMDVTSLELFPDCRDTGHSGHYARAVQLREDVAAAAGPGNLGLLGDGAPAARHARFLVEQLQAQWVGRLLALRGAGVAAAEVAAMLALQRLAGCLSNGPQIHLDAPYCILLVFLHRGRLNDSTAYG